MRFASLIALVCVFFANVYADENNRIALVVGNSNYEYAPWYLRNPVSDAESIALLLDDFGYSVDLVLDADEDELTYELERFGERMREIGSTAETIFYYAGHAAQDDGQNYLVPVDATVRTLEALKLRSPPIALLFSDMRQARNAANIVILDACRDMPLPRAYNGVALTRNIGGGGLASIQTTPNVFFAFAATEGNTAADGRGVNSPFTTALIRQLEENPALPISLLFERVAIDVIIKTDGAQRPEFRWGLEVPNWNFRHGRDSADANELLAAFGIGDRDAGASTDRGIGPEIRVFTAKRHGDLVIDECEKCPELIALRGGTFKMGNASAERHEKPVREITLKPFAIGKAEITFEEWEACVAANVCEQNNDREGWGRGAQPVYEVSWHEAQNYVKWLSDETGENYRLPTEAEWEYAARAGVTTDYPFGDDKPAGIINCSDCSSQDSSVRPRKAVSSPNDFGLYNTLGNLAEWVQDCYQNNLKGVGESGEANEKSRCSHRVTRGGSFVKGADHARHSSREKTRASTTSYSIGFRVARDLPRGVRTD